MESSAVAILTWVQENFVFLASVVLALWITMKILFATQHRWFAWVMHICTKDEFLPLEEVKKDHFASMASIVSHDPELREKKAIRILEIGVGTGVNFQHYPDGSHLVVVDPNPHFKEYYNDNKKKFPKIHAEDIIVTTGDDMSAVADESIDVVVMTLVLCSVQNVDKILQEILRVLAPGGKYYFMEHIQEFDLEKHSLRRRLQDFFTWNGLWPFIFDGCCLNRDMLPDIKQAGFSSVDSQKYYAPVPNFLFDLERPNVKGVAIK